VRQRCTAASAAARLAAIPAGESPADTRSPGHAVVISSGSKGDRTAGSLEVKPSRAGETWSDPSHEGEHLVLPCYKY
jgi:hypothetical protein